MEDLEMLQTILMQEMFKAVDAGEFTEDMFMTLYFKMAEKAGNHAIKRKETKRDGLSPTIMAVPEKFVEDVVDLLTFKLGELECKDDNVH